MPMLSAAALGALLGASYPTRSNRRGALRGRVTASRARSRARYSASRYRRRYRRSSKRAWQARARRTVGVPRNFSTAKTAVGYNTVDTAKFDQKLNAASCVRITKGPEINQRMRDAVIVSGVRIQFAIRNDNAYTGFVNWAVVHPKDETSITDTQPDFFRDYGATRSWNANAADKNGMEWSYAAINTDKFDILRRGKFMLGSQPSQQTLTSISYNKDTMKEMDIYVKLGRTFTFDTTEGAEPFENVYFCWWFASPLAGKGTGLGDGVKETTKIITYFREPKTG